MADVVPSDATEIADWRCYRHPDREGGVRCRRCQKPICPDCMIQASVGFQCPSCAKQGPAVRTLKSLRVDPHLTYGIIGVCVLLFLPSARGGAGGDLSTELGLIGFGVTQAGEAIGVNQGEWWRLFSSAFLHAGFLHLGFNMYILFQLGKLLEPSLGRLRFGALYITALMGGSFGALLLSPNGLTVGASGAVYGLIGAAILAMRRQGISPMQSGLGTMLLINLVITFVIPSISIGGHLGGLAAGAAAGTLLFATEDGDRNRRMLGLAGCLAIFAVATLGALAVGASAS